MAKFLVYTFLITSVVVLYALGFYLIEYPIEGFLTEILVDVLGFFMFAIGISVHTRMMNHPKN